MAAQERVQRTKSEQKRVDVQTENVKTSSSEELKAEMDDVLDEIDAVLEENAEEFVKGFVQKGGE